MFVFSSRSWHTRCALVTGVQTCALPIFQFNQFGVQVGVSAFELDFWGRVRNLSEAARQQYLATVEGKRAFRLSLIANIAATYYAARAGEEGIEQIGRASCRERVCQYV